jgi:ribose transport system substrate-binding protein
VGTLSAIEPAIEKAVQAGIPVITFDSDAPNSKRIVYIGTDNYFESSQGPQEVGPIRGNMVPWDPYLPIL